jgi:hypothetical protein
MLRHRGKPQRAPDGKVDPAEDGRWLITDFVTLGSPLTHADFLLTSNATRFAERKSTREFPTSPPVAETVDVGYRSHAEDVGLLSPGDYPCLLSFPFAPNNWQMHHAAAFAVTRWTNIYDPAKLIFCGDFISGPLANLFGPGVIDVSLGEPGRRACRFTHTNYWRQHEPNGPPERHIVKLREALNLAGQFGAI